MQYLKDHLSELQGKTAIVRCNFDVPLDGGIVGDTTRIEASVATLKALRQHQCRLILIAHAGRPDGTYQAEFSLQPIIPILSALLQEEVVLAPYQANYQDLQFPQAPIVLMDNLRFYPQEEVNDPEFAAKLASSADFYVNEAFANCHRAHASMIALPQAMSGRSYLGISLSNEVIALERVTHDPARPLVVIIGGAKVETKEPLVLALASKADQILVGGKIAADLKAKPLPGNVVLAELTPDGKDITEASARHFADIIMRAQTIIWNGTLGIFEQPPYDRGTTIVAQAVNQTSGFTFIGGGDTETALTKLNLEAGIDYISTGGGAMLTYLSEGHLVALDVL